MSVLPTGTVTFLFTDIEGSTKLWEQYPEAMKAALSKHDSILKEAVESNHGQIVKTTGDGIHAVFPTAIDAINAAIESQHALAQTSEFFKNSEVSLRARMGIHTGEAELREDDYFGQTLNRAARIMSAGHGGQILISDVVAQVAREHLSADVSLVDLGEHYLKGVVQAEKIYQIVAPNLQEDFPPLNSIPSATNNLPQQLTSFIGRERELREACEKLASAKLLTLIGPGGTGKTRLSIQIGADGLAKFKHGVWLIELAPISDPAYIIPAIASVFEIRGVQNIPLIRFVLDYLRLKEILLILDNCEHLVEASAQVVGQLLHECPQLKIVASSREALGVDGETVYRVPSLKDDEATRLFVERGTKAEPRFRLTDENASFVAQICSRLDGIPLAIELAAARVKLLTPEQIAARLDDRFKLLTGGVRTALPRQQTLRALIDWSYQLLNPTEQRALRGLSVFSGGWTLEAAESVVGADEALDGLAGLVNKSLVIVEEQDGKSRYRFLETIRQYAMEKLVESGEAVATRDRHLDFMLGVMQYSPTRMFGLESLELLNEIESEHDNLRIALEWAGENHPAKALKLAYSAGGFWTIRDYNAEAQFWCSAILRKTESMSELEADRARLYSLLGWLYMTLGEHKKGRAASEQAIALGERHNDFHTISRSYAVVGLASCFLGDFAAALPAAEKGERIAREHDLIAELSFILGSRAQLEFIASGDLPKARVSVLEASELVQKAGFIWASTFLDIGMGHIAAVMGDLETARAAFGRSAETAKRLGNKRGALSSLSDFAHVLRQHVELDEALMIYKDVLPKWKDLGHRAAVAHVLECIGFVLIRKEEPERAINLLGAANALREAIDSEMTQIEREEHAKEVSALRELLGEAAFNKEWEKGRKMTMDEAIELAVKN
ncbi:MAG TPA: adenylate/guanylate cyclase domain-containing protein [Anaerolineales bacterium]|nr:adenylate/guanylate cyclase domain-containing protein [Anaerolineales bacterium]